MLCGDFILPEPASYVFFYALFNLRNLLYIIGTYTFENVTSTHTIEAVFMRVNGNPQTGVMVDETDGSYYKSAWQGE